jgi:hypothetical protein
MNVGHDRCGRLNKKWVDSLYLRAASIGKRDARATQGAFFEPDFNESSNSDIESEMGLIKKKVT